MAEKKPSYWEQLRDPRWQQKRLRVMERDGWKCCYCDSKDNTLNVHHGYYERGLSPWEYPDDTLLTLCEQCHQLAQEWMRVLHREAGFLVRLPAYELHRLIGFARGIRMNYDQRVRLRLDDLEWPDLVADGIGRYWGLHGDTVVIYSGVEDEMAEVITGEDLVTAIRERDENAASERGAEK